MKQPAAITGSLVDVRNVGTHKCVKLTVHIPAEYAAHVLECFGWPTGVDPVTVAIARLNPEKATEQPATSRDKKSWNDMTPAQQAGILCAEKSFQKFAGATDEDAAAEYVRTICRVESRKDIMPGTTTAQIWQSMVQNYRDWMRLPEYVG